jgi:hypothetical protein
MKQTRKTAVEQLDGSKLRTTLSYLMVKMFEQDLY